MDEPLQIRSYRVVFSLERRLHRIDRFRIPLPYGLPLRSAGYAAAVLIVVLAIGRVPGLGAAVGALPTPVRVAVLPGVASYLLTRLRIDGRRAGAAGIGALTYFVQPRQLAGWQARGWGHAERLADVTVAPSADGHAMRGGVIHGPCDVVLRYPVAARRRGRTTIVRQTSEAADVATTPVVLQAGERLVVR